MNNKDARRNARTLTPQQQQQQVIQRGVGSTARSSDAPAARSRAAHRGMESGSLAGAGGYVKMSEDEKERGDKAAASGNGGQKTRLEGRGSSAAQRAAASEACKSISLERLQAQYHRPLSEVARDLKVSVARLLKKCREFGILRWPYRHVRSVQESIDQLEKDKETATDEVATNEMDLRLRLLRRRGELVVHFASCWLESDMRKGIFLADPRDVDSMLATAHETHSRRRIPPKGWESIGRFPDMAVREHFLEQMRAYLAGGAPSMSPPASNSPRRSGLQCDGPDSANSSVDDNRQGLLRQLPQQQQQQQQQAYHGASFQAPWQQKQHQQHELYHSPPQPWPGTSHNLYGGGAGGRAGVGRAGEGGGAGAAGAEAGGAHQSDLAYPQHYWGSKPGGVPTPLPPGAGGVFMGNDFGRARSPPHVGEYPPLAEQASSPLGYSSASWPSGLPAAAAAVVPAMAIGGGRSRHLGRGGGGGDGGGSNSITTPANIDADGYYHDAQLRGPAPIHGGAQVGDQVQRQLGVDVWGGGGSRAAPGSGMDGGDTWQTPDRQSPPPPVAQRGWVTGGLASSARGEFPPCGGGGSGGGLLPSIFQLTQQRELDIAPLPANFPATSAVTSGLADGARGAVGGIGASGGAVWGGGGVGGGLGSDDGHWGGAAAASGQQQQQQQTLTHIVSSARWQDAGGGGGSVADTDLARGGSFDRTYGSPRAPGRHRGSEGGGGGQGNRA